MQTTTWQQRHSRHTQNLTLDRRSWIFLAGLIGALYACINPLSL